MAAPPFHPTAVLAALAALGVLSARAGGDGPVATGIRAEMLSEYRYGSRQAAVSPAAAPSSQPPLAAALPDDVVRLPSYVVFESRGSSALGDAVQAQAADSRRQAVLDKLGIGIKAVPLGKHFQTGVVRVFYVPILVFGGFSW